MINAGVNVLLITNLDSESGSACLKKAQDAGIATIDYDRLTLGGGASYYVSFDNVQVGQLMAEGLQKCLTDAGKTEGANFVQINGDPTDNNAALFKQGYAEGMKAMSTRRLQARRRPDRPVGRRRPARRSSSCSRRTAARSTASSPRTTRWPAASSPASRPTA